MVYDKVKDLAGKKGMSISKLEKASGLSNGAISKWKFVTPTADNLKAVAKILGVKVDILLE